MVTRPDYTPTVAFAQMHTPRFLDLDRCRWAKDAGRRSEQTGSSVEGTTLHCDDDFSLGVSFSNKKTPRRHGQPGSFEIRQFGFFLPCTRLANRDLADGLIHF